jgi:homoserine dehydrogenase
LPAPFRIALVGFGNVGRRFAELLPGPYASAFRALGLRPVITGIATGRHGMAIDPRGLPLGRALRIVRAGRSLDALNEAAPLRDALAFVRAVPADVLVEISPLDPQSGQPAVRHVRAALERGMHVVTANKGPVAFSLASLKRLAKRRGVGFRHEGAVMDGMPVFNLVERCLPGTRVTGFRGVLNATTTRILSRMEEGASFARALREAQVAGIAEVDPGNDIDGWDAAVKACALANALMGADVRPPDVRRRGIRGVRPEHSAAARRAGARIRLVARGRRVAGRLTVSVLPERLRAGDLLATDGADGILELETDLMGEIGIWEGRGGVDQTAYALLSDLVAVAAPVAKALTRRSAKR